MRVSAAPARPKPNGWLVEVAKTAQGPAPWPGMGLAALAVGVPLAVGIAAGHTIDGVLASVGGLVAALADRVGPYPVRMRRIATAGIFGGEAGLLIGTAINGRGWLTVAAMVVVAGLSALLSSINATWSTTGLYLLVYAALATGPLGAIRPWWLGAVWLLAGVGWTLLLLVPGWLLRPRTIERRRVAAVYRALAANLRAVGTDGLGAARHGVAAALNAAYEDLRSERATASGADPELTRLATLLGQVRLAIEAAAALGYANNEPPPQAAAQADAIAEAVLNGKRVPRAAPPSGTSAPTLALQDALNGASDIVSGRKAVLPEEVDGSDWLSGRRRPLAARLEQVREALGSTFTIRLMLCIGVASVFSEMLPLRRSYWVVLAVAVVMKPDFGSVFARALQYGAGTLIGAAIGALILAGRPPDAVLLVPMVLFAALLPYGMSRNYGLFGVFFTPLVVLLIDLLSHDGWRLAEDRLIDIALGCVIVLVLGYAPWPSSWHANLRRDFADALDGAAAYLEQALIDPTPAAAATHARARSRQAALAIDFQRALAEPQPVRRRVTAWWPAIVALEQLLEAVTATAVTSANSPTPAANELSAALRRLAADVRSGTPVRPEAELPRLPSLELVSDAVRSIQEALAYTPPQPQRPPTPRLTSRTGVMRGICLLLARSTSGD
jgi:uncharacterized membrane protein YccC